MLIRFALTNFKSFADRAELSLVAGRSKQHPSHVVDGDDEDRIPILRLALIYGANASGKSNLCRAIDAARDSVVYGARTNRLVAHPFKLDESLRNGRTRFEFEIQVDDRYYLYDFSVTSNRVLSEKLSETTRESETILFERDESGHFSLDGLHVHDHESQQFLEFTAKAIPKHRLFVTECHERSVDEQVPEAAPILSVYRWFSEQLVTVFPESKFLPLQFALHHDSDFRDRMRELLADADTGVEGIGLQLVPMSEIELDPAMVDILDGMDGTPNEGVFIVDFEDDSRYLASFTDDGNWEVHRVTTKRRDRAGELVDFRTSEESAGTRRLLDLFPAMMANVGEGKVFVVDEIGRSMHPALSRHFVASFLSCCDRINSQLIFTTHEDVLLDNQLVRRDEVWFAEKNRHGASSLRPLEEFRTRPDLDIRKGYLDGRFGGVPLLRPLKWKFANVSDA